MTRAATVIAGMQRLQWSALDEAARARVLQRPTQAVSDEVRAAVAEILQQVDGRGDAALREFTQRFDGLLLQAFAVDAAEFEAAELAVTDELRAAMVAAAARIEAFHRAGMTQAYAVETAPGVICERIVRPIRRVGLYVPAGTAPLPSTALMLGVPARLAGCAEVVMCTPPRSDGSADPAVLVAARLCGITRVLKLGGAQAIAAMACGTASVPACDKLFGPGNAFVTEAKRQVAARMVDVAIDMPAGPSEVLVIADDGADARFVAADLLSQAEHGGDSQVLLLSDSERLVAEVAGQIELQLAVLPRAPLAMQALRSARLVLVDDIDTAFAISNRYAPEHLILALREPRAWLSRVEAAGSVFLGDWTPEALGDYCSGTNHVLPTGGAARSSSGLSVASFQNTISVQSADARGLAAIGPCAITLADAEGLQAHANAVALRLQQLASPGRAAGSTSAAPQA